MSINTSVPICEGMFNGKTCGCCGSIVSENVRLQHLDANEKCAMYNEQLFAEIAKRVDDSIVDVGGPHPFRRKVTWGVPLEDIRRKFPKILKATTANAALIEARRIGALTQPIGVLTIGAPSGQKTTGLRLFKTADNILWLDDFTPASIVSHKAGATEKELEKIDLLPKLKDTALLAPEFSTILEGAKDQVAGKLARLTRIMDGDGFMSASGQHGQRGYDEHIMFIILGASVPLSHDQWDVFVRAGARFLFVNLDDEATFEELLPNEEYRPAIESIQERVREFFACAPNLVPTLTREQQKGFFELAAWVAKLRGVVSSRGTRFIKNGQEFNSFDATDMPVIEAPPRLYSMFCALAQGHASLYNRTAIVQEDMDFSLSIALDCGRADRFQFLRKMPQDTYSSVSELRQLLHISKDTIRRRLAECVALGLVIADKRYGEDDKPTTIFKPVSFSSERFTKKEPHQDTLHKEIGGEERENSIVKSTITKDKEEVTLI